MLPEWKWDCGGRGSGEGVPDGRWMRSSTSVASCNTFDRQEGNFLLNQDEVSFQFFGLAKREMKKIVNKGSRGHWLFSRVFLWRFALSATVLFQNVDPFFLKNLASVQWRFIKTNSVYSNKRYLPVGFVNNENSKGIAIYNSLCNIQNSLSFSLLRICLLFFFFLNSIQCLS